jgi:uncharacterized protein YjdB
MLTFEALMQVGVVHRLLFLLSLAAALPLAAPAQTVTVSPTSISFGNQAQGTSGSVHKATLKNGQSSAITITSISTNLADYSQTNNCPMSPTTLAAGASCTISITFTPSAQGARNATLTVVDTGKSSPQLVTLTGTGTAAILESIAVTPSTASIIAAETQQFTATGTYSDGSTQNLTTTANWSSSNTSIATVGLHTGLAKGVTAGNATITATSGKVSGSAALTVTAAVLTSITVKPATVSVAAGKTQQFTATGNYNNGTTQTLTNTATWTSSATSVATVSSGGLATSVAQGSATITASSGTISGSATLTVTAAVLTSIAVTPSPASVATGSTLQFTATGTYSNGTTQNLTTTASWTSSNTSVATVKLHTGLATGVASGTATITASSGTIHGTATLTVTAALTSIAVTPATATLAAGYTQQFTATGTYSDGSTQNLTNTATWTSSASSIATVNSGGLATGVAQGTATIKATSGTISGSATLTVTAPVLTSISVTPAAASIAAGYTQQFTATGNYSDSSTQNLTATANWTSSNTAVATIAGGGLAISLIQGSATITATSGTISGSASLTVTAAVLTSLSVSPANPSIAAGTTQQFTATGTYSDSSTQNLTSTATWTSSLTSVATIAAGGLATGEGVGTSTITASSGSITGSTSLAVSQPVLVSIAVTPANPSFALGTTLQLAAIGTYSDGSTLDLTATATWSSANSSFVTVNGQGSASSVAVGSASITAASGTITGSTTLTVTAAVLVSIAVTPAIPTLPVGLTQQFTATGTFTDGSTQNITGSAQWSSNTPAVATIISTSGLATSVAQGSTTITATSGSVSGSTTMTVTAATLVSIAVTPATPSIAPGTIEQFTATGTYTDGSTQNLTSTATWSSGTPATATINNAGLATSAAQGTATISAASGSVSGSTLLTVTAATLVSIAINPPTSAVAPGTTQQFTATGTFSDGTTQNLTQSGHWSSTAATVSTISDTASTAGLASSLTAGTTTISISSGSVYGSATLVVNPVSLVSIAINPQTPTIALGTTLQFAATGTFTDSSTQNLTSVVTWSSSAASDAIVSNSVGSSGLATSSGLGTTTISATSNSISASTTLTVSAPGPTLVSIAITPASASIALGTTQQFVATGTYSDGSTQNLTSSVTWISSATGVATISSVGLATSIATGTSTITATSGAVSGTTTLTVTPALVSISLSPSSSTLTIGNSSQLTATGTYSDGSTQNVTTSASWTSSSSSTATVLSGLVTAVADGSVSITASLSGVTSPAATADIGTAADYYVATNGNDSWSGTLWDPNATGTDGPFATIARAQTAVQAILANPNGRATPITVLIRAGTYYQQALTFTSADSGTATLQVQWENYPNEAPILSGGMLVTGWTNTTGSTYQVTLPTSAVYFENLFYNGGRRLRPRVGGSTAGPIGTYLRNAGPIYLSGSPPPSSPPNVNCAIYVSGSGWECFDRFKFNPGDVSSSWTNLNPPYPTGDIELLDFEWWSVPKMRISSIDSVNNIVYLTGPVLQVALQHGFILNHRYIVENVKDLLTQGGQWFLDRSAVPWTLTYIANPGENPPTDTVVIPQSSQVMTATGLKYVTFQGLQFQNDNFTVSSTGYISIQQEPLLTGAVSCYNCQYVTFNNDIITQTAGSGIEFKTTSNTATTAYNTFENGALYDIGGVGIRVGEPPASTDTDANVPQFTTIENTLIEGISRVFPSAPGIVQGSGHDNTYTYNDIYDGYHSGIEVCLAATCPPGKTNSSGTFNNVVSFSHIFDLYEGVTDDGGGIYFATGGPAFAAAGNKILNNKVHDTSDASIIDSDGYGGNGINLDGSTGLVTVQNNLVYRISANALNITHGPQLPNLANTINNNIFAYARKGMISNGNPYPTYACPSSPVTVFNTTSNLFYFDRKSTQSFYVQQGCEYSCGFPITDLHNWQSNLYWRTDSGFYTDPAGFHSQPTADGSLLCGGAKYEQYYYFAGWQGLGEDVAGVANLNPGFADPVYPYDNYSLPNGSPGVGFTVFNPSEAGRNNPIINPTDLVNIPATFPTAFFNPASDY